MGERFWETKSLSEYTDEEWEALCDGCAKCCLHKLEDEDTGDVYYTRVACRLLDLATCQCADYDNRVKQVSDCLKLSQDHLSELQWLPSTCAYRLVYEGKSLPDWHHLETGNRKTVIETSNTVAEFAISEDGVPEQDFETHIIRFV